MSVVSQDEPEVDEGSKMSEETQENKEHPDGGARSLSKSVAHSKWDEDRGEELAYVAKHFLELDNKPRRAYELIYRIDLLGKDDDMLLLKGVHEGVAEIAFVFAPGLLSGIASMAGLMRSGRLKWREDEYPSRKLAAYLETLGG